jgi:cytochrome c peroxidase
MALVNLAFRETLLWDGRGDSLEEQALMPLLEQSELHLSPDVAVELLAAVPEYVERFAAAFPDDPEVTVDNLASALAAFQRTIVSNRSPYDAYLRGHLGALDDELVEGMHRFAEMGCPSCHVPPLFESETFANRNVVAVEGIDDRGRAEVTERAEDIGKFRTPSLRNGAVTEPYFHNGSVPTLEGAVAHELQQTGQPFDDEDVRLIEQFIRKALRDESRAAQRPRHVPSGLPVPLDGQFFPHL